MSSSLLLCLLLSATRCLLFNGHSIIVVNGSVISGTAAAKSENNLSIPSIINNDREAKAYHHDHPWLKTMMTTMMMMAKSSPSSVGTTSTEDSSFSSDLKHLYKIYEECNAKDLSSCLKFKLVTALDRLSRKTELPITDGVVLVKDDLRKPIDDSDTIAAADNNEISAAAADSLPRSLAERDEKLDDMIAEKLQNFFSGRSVQFKLSTIQRSLEGDASQDGRGKKNKMGSLLMIPIMMAGSMIPLALGTLALLAGKALIIAKLALTLSLIIGLKKLVSQDDSHGSSYQVVHGGSGGGHFRRSIQASDAAAAAQNMAYRSYIPLNPDSSTNMYVASRR